MKNKKYIQKIKIIATADIANGNKDKLLKVMKELIKQEKYEDCEGIKQALTGGDK
jgi:hypothetical protein